MGDGYPYVQVYVFWLYLIILKEIFIKMINFKKDIISIYNYFILEFYILFSILINIIFPF